MKQCLMRLFCCLFSLTAVTGISADGTWSMSAGGEWGISQNWQGGVIADGGKATFPSLTSSVISVDNERPSLSLTGMTVNGNYDFIGNFIAAYGTVSVAAGKTATFRAGLMSSSNQNLTFDREGTTILDGEVSRNHVNAIISVKKGTLRFAPNSVYELKESARRREHLQVNTGGIIEISTNATVTVGGFFISQTEGRGEIKIDGGTLITRDKAGTFGNTAVGDADKADGYLTIINGGKLISDAAVNLGIHGPATVLLDNGELNTPSLSFSNGNSGSNYARAKYSHMMLRNSSILSVRSGYFCWKNRAGRTRTNTVWLTSGSVFRVLPTIAGERPTSDVNDFGTSRLVVRGGILEATTTNTVDYYTGLDQLFVGDGGMTVSNDYPMTIVQPLTLDPETEDLSSLILTKRGSETLTLMDLSTHCITGWSLQRGTLSIKNGVDDSISLRSLEARGGSLKLDLTDSVSVSGLLTVSSLLTIRTEGTSSTTNGVYPVLRYTMNTPHPDPSLLALAYTGAGTAELVLDKGTRTVNVLVKTSDEPVPEPVSNAVWTAAGSGEWETASNWRALPEVRDRAQFGEFATSDTTVTLTEGHTLAGISVSNGHALTLAGEPITLTGSERSIINAPTRFAGTLATAGDVFFANTSTLDLGEVTGTGKVTVSGGSLNVGVSPATAGGLFLTDGVIANLPAAYGTAPLETGNSTISFPENSGPVSDWTLSGETMVNIPESGMTVDGVLVFQPGGKLRAFGGGPLLLNGSCDVRIYSETAGLFLENGVFEFGESADYTLLTGSRNSFRTGKSSAMGALIGVNVRPGARLKFSGMWLGTQDTVGVNLTYTQYGGTVEACAQSEIAVANVLKDNIHIVIQDGLFTATAGSVALGIHGKGLFEQTGGRVEINSLNLQGYGANSSSARTGSGELLIKGGVCTITGTLLFNSSSSVKAYGVLTLGDGVPFAGQLFTKPTTRVSGSKGIAKVVFNGGLLSLVSKNAEANADIFAGVDIVTNLTGGAIIDTQDADYTLKQNLAGAEGDGGIMKLGQGKLTLAGANNTFTGPMIVSNGTLSVTGTSAASSGLDVAPGATLKLATLSGGSWTTFKVASGATLEIASLGTVTAIPADTLLEGTLKFQRISPGTYSLGTFSGGSSAYENATLLLPVGMTGTFSVRDGRLTLLIETIPGRVNWTNAAGGNWEDAGNWSGVLQNSAADIVMFSDIFASFPSPFTVTVPSGRVAGRLEFDSMTSATLNGGTITLAGNDAGILVRKGDHRMNGPLASSSGTAVLTGTPESSLTVALANNDTDPFGGMSGVTLTDMRLTVKGGASEQTVSTALTIEGTASRLAMDAGKHVTLTGTTGGPGAFGIAGEGHLTVSGTLPSDVVVESGTLDVNGFAQNADLFLGSATLRNTSDAAQTIGGLTSDGYIGWRVPWLHSDSDVTLTKAVVVPNAMMKTGTGAITFATASNRIGYCTAPGVNYNLPSGFSAEGGATNVNVFTLAQGKVIFPEGEYINEIAGMALGYWTEGINGTSVDEIVAEARFLGGTSIFTRSLSLNRGLLLGTSRLLVDNATVELTDLIIGNTFRRAGARSHAEIVIRNGASVECGFVNSAECPGASAAFTVDGAECIVNGLFQTGHQSDNSGGATTTVSVVNGGLFHTKSFSPGIYGKANSEVSVVGEGSRWEIGSYSQRVGNVTGVYHFDGGTLALQSPVTISAKETTIGAGGMTFDVTGGVSAVFLPVLSHADGVTADTGIIKTGAGSLTLSGSGTYEMTGPIAVNEGILEFGDGADVSGSSGVTIAGGASFGLLRSMIVTQSVASLTCTGTAETPSIIRFSVDGDNRKMGMIEVEGSLVLGNTVIELYGKGSGDVLLLQLPLIDTTFPLFTYTGNAPSLDGVTVRMGVGLEGRVSLDTENHAVNVTINPDSSTDLGYTWKTIGNGNWTDGVNWNTGTSPLNAAEKMIYLPNSQSGSVEISLNQPVTIGALTYSSVEQYSVKGSEEGKLIFDNGIEPALITSMKRLRDGVKMNNIVDVPIQLSGPLSIVPTYSSSIALRQSVTGSENASITMAGPGTLILNMDSLSVPLTVDGDGCTVHGQMTGTGMTGLLTMKRGTFNSFYDQTIHDVNLIGSSTRLSVRGGMTLTVEGTVSGDNGLSLSIFGESGKIVLTKPSTYSGNTVLADGNRSTLALKYPGTLGKGRLLLSEGRLGAEGTIPVRISSDLVLSGNSLVAVPNTNATLILDRDISYSAAGKGIYVSGPGTLGIDTSLVQPNYLNMLRVEDGTLRLFPYAEVNLASETSPSGVENIILRAQISASTIATGLDDASKRTMGITVETNAWLQAYGLYVPHAQDASNTGKVIDDEHMHRFHLLLDGGTINLTAPVDCVNLGDNSGTVVRVTCRSGLFKTPSTAWSYMGARSPVILTQTGGRFELGNFSMGRGEWQGVDRFGGQTELYIYGGTFSVNGKFCWLGGTSARTNRLVVGNGAASDARVEIPPTSANFQYNKNAIQTILTMNGGTLSFHSTEGSSYSPADFLQGATRVEVGEAGAKIEVVDLLTATVKQTLLPVGDDPAITGDLTKLGTGTLVLKNAGSFTGKVDVAAGTLKTASVGGRRWRVAKDAVLDLANVEGMYTSPELRGAGTVSNGTVVLGAGSVLASGDDAETPDPSASLNVENLRLDAGVEISLKPGMAVATATHLTVQGSGSLTFGFTEENPMPLPYTAEVMRYGEKTGVFRGWHVKDPNTKGRPTSAIFTEEDGVVRVTINTVKGTVILLR